MSRAIDSENLYKFLTDQRVKERGAYSKGVNTGLDIARSALRNEQTLPTLTPPNEWVSVYDRLRELVQADREGRCVVLNMPRKPLVWGDDDQNACLCPYCGRDLMGIPYGERMVLQCPECGQYLDVTKIITRAEAEAALREDTDEH